jgi:hypothetical protein
VVIQKELIASSKLIAIIQKRLHLLTDKSLKIIS